MLTDDALHKALNLLGVSSSDEVTERLWGVFNAALAGAMARDGTSGRRAVELAASALLVFVAASLPDDGEG